MRKRKGIMKLFAYHFHKKLWIFPVMGIYAVFLILLNPHRSFLSYHESAEVFMSLWVALFSALVLTSKAEEEFALCYGAPLRRILCAQWMPHWIYPFFIAVLTCPLYFIFHDFDTPTERVFASAGVRYTLLFFSFFVTFFFLSALMLFLRVLFGNLYVSFSAFALCYFPMYQVQEALSFGSLPASFVKHHIWITGFLLEDRFTITREMWLANRYFYFVMACVLTFLAFLLFKSKKES